MEETPEQVLARLERYVDALKARGHLVPSGARVPAAPSALPPGTEPHAEAATVMTAEAPELRHGFGTLSRTVAGQAICVATCVVTLVLWVNVTRAAAYIVLVNAAALCGIGLYRRFPFAGWALIGLFLGVVLGRFS